MALSLVALLFGTRVAETILASVHLRAHQKIEATAKVAQSLYRMATEGNNVAAAIFWMKARAGWREKQQVELTGPDGGPLQHQTFEDTREPIEAVIRGALGQSHAQVEQLAHSIEGRLEGD